MKQIIAILDSVTEAEVSQLAVRASFVAFMNRCRRNNQNLFMDHEVGSWLDEGSAAELIRASSAELEEIYSSAINTTLCPGLVKDHEGALIAVAMGPYSAGSLACAIPRHTSRKEEV